MQQPDWLMDEWWIFDRALNSGLDFSDPSEIPFYDEKSGDTAEEMDKLLDALGISERDTVIDFGAGTGLFALQAARRCKKVIAVDVSASMLTFIQKQARELGLDNVECVNQGFLTYEHRGAPVDYIYTKNAIHHISDFWKSQALVRMANILRPGGILHLRDLIFSFEPKDAERYIEAWLSNAPTDPRKGWTREELATHVREEYSTYSWVLEGMFQRAGFRIREASYSESKIFAAYTCVKV